MANKVAARDGKRTFGIGAVARMTGLTDHTIRVWERRYNAVVADRSANGRRVYRTADVEKLKLLKVLTDNGLAIGRIAAEPVEVLAARVEDMRELLSPVQRPSDVSVAILGDLLPALLKTAPEIEAPVRVLASGGQEVQLLADLDGQAPDVLVVELPVIAQETDEALKRLKKLTGSSGLVCVYGFARSEDAERIRANGVVLVRAPVTVEEAAEAIGRAAQSASRPAAAPPVPPVGLGSADAADEDGPIEPRLFSQQQLSSLARQSNAIACECPKHLADLVGALSAFEVYSANCVNVSEADAALHRYLHRTTARARGLVEQALDRVAREEGLIE